jgi:hypothetical protein
VLLCTSSFPVGAAPFSKLLAPPKWSAKADLAAGVARSGSLLWPLKIFSTDCSKGTIIMLSKIDI